MEEWKKCFENYEISNYGNCRRLLNSGNYKIVKGSINNRGYRYLQTNRKGKRKNYLFHHWVCECFIGKRPEGLVVDHKDRNKLNNNISNLHYTTQLENMRNTKNYRNDIETKNPKERKKIFDKERHKRNLDMKKFYCETCDYNTMSGYKLRRHSKSKKHRKLIAKIKKPLHIELLKKNNS